jgi:hypothetical protein
MNIRLVAVKKLMGDEDFYYRKDGTILPVNSVAVPTESEIQAKIVELQAAEPMRLLRIQRNQLLQETDWTQNRDVTLANDAEWAAYRQALRDLPNTATPELDEYGNLTNVTWPEKPE